MARLQKRRLRGLDATNALIRRVEGRVGSHLRVLTYHRVGVPNGVPDMVVSAAHLAEHLAVLNQEARIVALEDHIPRSCRTSAGRRRRYALTFDDGYADNLSVAVPIFEAHDAPATIFICSGYLDRPYFWWDRLADIAGAGDGDRERLEHESVEVGILDDHPHDGSCDTVTDSLLDRLRRRLAHRDLDEKQDLLDELGRRLGFVPDVGAPRPLTTDELHQLETHPLITIGVHTNSHLRLPSVPIEVASRDVVEGARALDDLLGPRRRLFAYPHGAVNSPVAKAVRQAGHRHALTTVSRPVSVLDGDLMLPRLATQDVDGEAFARQRGFSRRTASAPLPHRIPESSSDSR